MDNVNIILAAGTQTRWNSKLIKGLPDIKQLVEVKGEILIERIQRQFEDSIVITRSTLISKHSKMVFNPENPTPTIGALHSTHALWKKWTTILLGDVDYGNKTIKLIKNQSDPLMFYGNKEEIFALKFHETKQVGILMTIDRLINDPRWEPRFGKLWNLYRMLIGYDFRFSKIDKYFTFVNDCCDFDNKDQYIKYAQKHEVRK